MQPITAQAMRGLKAKKEEDIRLFQVQALTKIIYDEAVAVASTKTDTSYVHPVYYHPQNTQEVIIALSILFPGCRVMLQKFNRVCRGTPNTCKLVEVDNMDIFADSTVQDCIVVDWSLV
jgi:hypothetical protein